MEKPKTFDEKMEFLANQMTDALIANGLVDEPLLDAFKVLSGYQASSRKLSKLQSVVEDATGGGFGAAKRRIAAASESSERGQSGPAAATDGIN